MKEVEHEIKRLEWLESEDGQFRRHVGGLNRDSEDFKAARKAVIDYENSARGALGQIVMSMKHEELRADSYLASRLLTSSTECCESTIWLFKVETAEQFETLVKWMKLQYPGESIGVATPKPYYRVRQTVKDGKIVEVKDNYLTCYQEDGTIDPQRFIGHVVVVYDAMDYKMFIEGTLEEIEERNKFLQKELEDTVLSKLK